MDTIQLTLMVKQENNELRLPEPFDGPLPGHESDFRQKLQEKNVTIFSYFASITLHEGLV